MAKDPFSIIDADLAQVRGAVKADLGRRLRAGAVLGSARDGAVMITAAAPGDGQVSRVVKRYKKATVGLTQRTRQKAATPA